MPITLSTDRPTKDRMADSGEGWHRARIYGGTCYDFDGVNDYIDVGDTGQDVRTICFVLYADALNLSIIDLDAGTNTITVDSSGVITANGFTDATIYIDGIENNEIVAQGYFHITITTDTAIDVNDLDIGRVSTNYFNGKISNVKLFSEVLSSTQVFNNYIYPEQAVPYGVLSTAVVGWWTLAGDAVDSSGNGNDGTVTGPALVYGLPTPVYQTIVDTTGFGVLAGNEYGETPDTDNLDITTSISIAAWVKFTNTGSQETVIAKRNAWELAKSSGETVIMSIYQTSNKFTLSTSTLTADTWYYIVGTYTSGTMQIYINGVLDKTDTSYTGAIDTNAYNVTYGQNNSSTYWTGSLDEIKVYNSVLTVSEVISNYRAGLEAHT